MAIQFLDGDIFSTKGLNAYAHGCNCAGAMGKGIAVSFKERWQKMYLEYRNQCLEGEFKVGDVFVWEEDGNIVFNLGTQKTWRTKATLEAIRSSVLEMLQIAERKSIKAIAMPRVGAGLGGLNWDEVKNILEELASSSSVDLIVCENFKQGVAMF